MSRYATRAFGGTFLVPAIFTCTIHGVGTLSGTMSAKTSLNVTIHGVGALHPTLSAKTSLSTTMHGVGALNPTLTAKVALAKTITGVGTFTAGTMSFTTALSATITGVGTLNATLNSGFKATMHGVGALSGTMGIGWRPTITMSGIGTLQAQLPVFLYITMTGVGTFTPRLFAGGTGIVVKIDGTPYFVIAGTLDAQNAVGRRGTASFQLHTDTSVHFNQSMSVSIFNNGVLVYSGYITQVQEIKPGFQNSLIHTVQCTDQCYLADKRIIAASYVQQTPGTIAADILQNYLAQEGVTLGQIVEHELFPNADTLFPSPNLYPTDTQEQIPQTTFGYCTVAQALDAITARANIHGVPFYWKIDYNKQFWFVPYTAVANSTIIDGTQIDNKYNPMTVTRQNPVYRNRQYILGGYAQTLQQVEIRNGDGNTQSWTMGYDIAQAPKVEVNTGSGFTTTLVGVKGVDTGKNFYWSLGDPTITQDSNDTKLTNSNQIRVTYIGRYPSVTIQDDFGLISQEQIREGGATSGIVESVLNDTTIQSSGEGQAYAANLLSRYGVDSVIVDFYTLQTGFQSGQVVESVLPMHGIQGILLIESVTASDSQDDLNLWYHVSAIQGPYDNNWVSFFGDLIEAANQTPLQVGISSTLALAVDLKIVLAPTLTLTVVVNTPPLPSTTLHPSTTLYP